MIAINIDVKKIDKAALFTGKKGTYLNMTLMENREGIDQYGNEGFIVIATRDSLESYRVDDVALD